MGGAALLAVQAFTHSWGENQRYIRLSISRQENGEVDLEIPGSPTVIPGHYHLFLVGENGSPSAAAHVVLDSAKPIAADGLYDACRAAGEDDADPVSPGSRLSRAFVAALSSVITAVVIVSSYAAWRQFHSVPSRTSYSEMVGNSGGGRVAAPPAESSIVVPSSGTVG